MPGFSNYNGASDGFPDSGTYSLIDFEGGIQAKPITSQGGTVTNGGLSTPSSNVFQ